MRKNLIFSIIAIAALAVLLSGCFLMPKASLTAGNYYLVTSFNDWSENPSVLKDYAFKNDELTIDTSAHATFLYYVIKADENGNVIRYGSKDAPVFAYGKSDSTFYVKPSMLKVGEIVGIGDNTKNDKDFWIHGSIGHATWAGVKMQRLSGEATLTYTATEIPMGTIEFKITVATSTWINTQTFNGHWNGVGDNIKFNLTEDASELTIEFNPLTDFATMTYKKSPIPLTPEYYVVGSLNGWDANRGIQLTDPDGDGVFTAATSTTTHFATSTNNVVEYKVVKKFKTSVNWFGLGNHFFSATPTSVNFYMTVDPTTKDPKDYGTDMAAMDNLPLAVAGSFNSWGDTIMKAEDSTYEATLSGNFQAGDYELKIKKPGDWNSYKYPDSNYIANLSQAASEIKITFDPKTWDITLTKVK
jgi:hypothetical protein